MRAMEPNEQGWIERAGARVGYEVFGDRDRPTLVLMPSWCVVHSRIWKMQVPYLARHYRVITWDGVGNGLSDRPVDPARYTAEEHALDTLAILDATGTERCVVVSASLGTHRSLRFAVDNPERVDAIVFGGPAVPFGGPVDGEINAAFLSGDQQRFLEVFMQAAFMEPHSTKPIEDAIGWGNETTLEVLGMSFLADQPDAEHVRALAAAVACPVLVIQGTIDRLTPEENGRALAEAIGDNASLVLFEGSGHRPDVRDPVRYSLLVKEFVETIYPRSTAPIRTWTTSAARRRRRALFLSSPIGLGHARRDIAIARALREHQPDTDIQWLAQDPVTRALEVAGETVHPASAQLVSEVTQFEAETAGHDLHCFHAWRELDEVRVSNFMVLHDLLNAETFDLVVGDEAWENDHFLHENPELKRTAYAWLTDFVGFLPMPAGGERESFLTADYNQEMLEHLERYPRVRDRSLFVGNPDDVIDEPFGDGLPSIRAWTEAHFDFPGYISGITPVGDDERAALRRQLGYRDDELVCIATAGGTGVGRTLLTTAIGAFRFAAKQEAALRMVVVAGPRIDPSSFEVPDGAIDVLGYVPDLDQHLAACDVALVQGGLTTAMELTANRRPFLYFPLANHFEQQRHVPQRLDRYGAGRRMDHADVTSEEIADALLCQLASPADYRPVETDGATRAAAMLAELL